MDGFIALASQALLAQFLWGGSMTPAQLMGAAVGWGGVSLLIWLARRP